MYATLFGLNNYFLHSKNIWIFRILIALHAIISVYIIIPSGLIFYSIYYLFCVRPWMGRMTFVFILKSLESFGFFLHLHTIISVSIIIPSGLNVYRIYFMSMYATLYGSNNNFLHSIIIGILRILFTFSYNHFNLFYNPIGIKCL